MILTSYFFLRIFNLKLEKESFYQLIKDFFIIGALFLATLYVVGYFEIRVVDGLARGFGETKLNLLSVFHRKYGFYKILNQENQRYKFRQNPHAPRLRKVFLIGDKLF